MANFKLMDQNGNNAGEVTLNDNVFKLVVSLLALKLLVTETGGTFYLSLGGALFVLPYILFSPYAGYLADHFSKTKIIKITKIR